MPNWCMTTMTIRCESKETAEGLYEKIKEWTAKEYRRSDFGKNWLGNIVGNSGIDAMEDGKEFSVKCRGSLTHIDVSDKILTIETQTAWSPMLKMWVMICDRYLGKDRYKLLYCAEEEGSGLYVTNDPAYSDTYDVYVDETPETEMLCDIMGTDSALELREDELAAMLQEYFTELVASVRDYFKTKSRDVKTLLGKFWNSPAGDFVEIKKCRYADIADWE